MKSLRILAVLALLSGMAFGQGVRFGDGQPIWTTVSTSSFPSIGIFSGSFPLIGAIPSALVSFCNAPANAVPCTNKATTYTDSTLATPCSTSTQIVLAGTSSCVALTDSSGNWGVWAAPGQYTYTVTVNGVSAGPYYASLTYQPASGSSLGFQRQVFNSSGTFTVPTRISQVKVTVTGGGGAGQGGTSGGAWGFGGSAAGTAVKWIVLPAAGNGTNTITITVGTGGTGVSGGSGNNGTDSTVASGTGEAISTVTGIHGLGGGVGSTGGGASGGDLNLMGGPGNPNIGTVSSGAGAVSFWAGGGGPVLGNVAGNNGTAPGSGGSGGGGGASNTAGGNGANGVVVVEWVN